MTAYAFWVKVFALTFALGVVTGITMSFQFGTNWPGYMLKVGNIAGPLLAYEVLTAFFLEATFLGVMLFGRDRVSDGMHTLATFLVAFGTTVSAFWILALNSWMQTPTGYVLVGGVVHVDSWLAVIFNPSFPYRLTHMLLASGLTASFLIAGLSAYQWLRGDRAPAVRAALRAAVFVAAALIPVQVLVGDQHGLNTLHHQPAKIAAIEGVWETERGAPILLFGLPNERERRNDYALGVPKVASLILTHDLEGEIRGLAEFPEHPPVLPVFWAFRVMVGVAMLMLAVSWLSAWQLRRGGELGTGAARLLVGMTFAGWVATLAGWWVTEIGRQPWLVTGILLARDAASATPAPLLGLSLGMYLSLYAFLIVSYVGVLFHLARKRKSLDAEPELGQELPK
jgi:cytochrome d ubiquinol oxidase subunit I